MKILYPAHRIETETNGIFELEPEEISLFEKINERTELGPEKNGIFYITEKNKRNTPADELADVLIITRTSEDNTRILLREKNPRNIDSDWLLSVGTENEVITNLHHTASFSPSITEGFRLTSRPQPEVSLIQKGSGVDCQIKGFEPEGVQDFLKNTLQMLTDPDFQVNYLELPLAS